MEIVVTDRTAIERGIVVRSAYVVVSIHDPDKSRARIPQRVGLRDVLFLAFHDAEPLEGIVLPVDIQLMTARQSRRIVSFAEQYCDRAGTIVCQCEQGMSRSPAVAAALCEMLNQDANRFFETYQPNLYVYDLVLRAAR